MNADRNIDCAAPNALPYDLFDRPIQSGISIRRADINLEIPAVDRANLDRNRQPLLLSMRSTIAGHAQQQCGVPPSSNSNRRDVRVETVSASARLTSYDSRPLYFVNARFSESHVAHGRLASPWRRRRGARPEFETITRHEVLLRLTALVALRERQARRNEAFDPGVEVLDAKHGDNTSASIVTAANCHCRRHHLLGFRRRFPAQSRRPRPSSRHRPGTRHLREPPRRRPN